MALVNKPTQAVQPSVSSIHATSPPRLNSMEGAIVSSALEALQTNRLRSFLTMLGVIIGVSAVISVVTLTQGVNQSVANRFASLGTNVLTISSGTSSTSGARSAAGSSQTLTIGDVQALTQVNHVVNISPILSASGQVIYQGQNWNTRIQGVYPTYQTIQNWQIAEGDWFSDQAEQMGTPDAILGQTVVTNLFTPTGTDPIGETIRINDQLFHVVGVLQTKGTQGAANSDDVIFVPFSAASERLKPSPIYVDQIQVQIDTVNNITQAQQDITTLLRARHHLLGQDPSQSNGTPTSNRIAQNPAGALGGGGGNFGGGRAGGGGGNFGGGRAGGGNSGNGNFTGGQQNRSGFSSANGVSRTLVAQPNDFQVFNVNQLVQTAQQNSAELTILLVGIAGISLTIGGIGIMNIMLVSVTERTREIGIRMAVGARRSHIRNQFLVEALMLSIFGGVIGILLGLLGGFALTVSLGFPFTFSFIAMAIAFTVSAVVGVIFGLYPAVRAANLDPIVALRVE